MGEEEGVIGVRGFILHIFTRHGGEINARVRRGHAVKFTVSVITTLTSIVIELQWLNIAAREDTRHYGLCVINLPFYVNGL